MQKTNIPQSESKSVDLIAQNLEQLKQIFPEVIKEGKVDFEALNDLLGNYGDTAEERFCLNWAGKANARREAQKRSTGTLRPCPEESVDWDTTDNLYIEGDNLEVLKLLQKSYHSRVKMIYIDPPYNTGKDFVYKDNYTDNMKNYLELTGQDKKISTNTESDGRYHSNWLNMMYPRLKLARNLLTDDGVIFISIDDNEVANLRKVCDEIFGEENFVAQVIWEQGRKSMAAQVAINHEYCLVYNKNRLFNISNTAEGNSDYHYWATRKLGLNDIYDEYRRLKAVYKDDFISIENGMKIFYKALSDSNPAKAHNHYKCVDANGLYFPGDIAQGTGNGGRFEIIHPITGKSCKIPAGGWRFSANKLPQLLEENRIHFGLSEQTIPCLKRYLTETEYEVVPSVFYKDGRGASKRLEQLLEVKGIFPFPKDEEIIKIFVSLAISPNDDIILDSFGSATTAHAVMQLNAEDGGNRKYICVQIPEPTPEESEARKAGYATIPEIGKERIRRAGKKILEEQKAKAEKESNLFAEEEPKKLDTGFKVFKLDSSNINAWDSDPDNLETSLNSSLFNIKTERSEDDLLYEILIKYGIELTTKINRHSIDGKTVYEMGAGSLIVCLADSLSTAVADGIGKLYKEVSPEGIDCNCRVVFKETGFNGSDEVKTNTLLILKQHGITNVATV